MSLIRAQEQPKTVGLYLKNHAYEYALKDFQNFLPHALNKEFINLEVTENLNHEITLIIDEFSDASFVRKLKKIYKGGKKSLIIIETEFETTGVIAKTFNNFNEQNKLMQFLTEILGTIVYLVPGQFKLGILFVLICDYLIKIFKFTKLLPESKHTEQPINVFSKKIRLFRKKVYMRARYLGFKEVIKFASYRIKVHSKTSMSHFPVLMPVFNRLDLSKNNEVFISGTETIHRLNQCSRFKSEIISSNIPLKFEYHNLIPFYSEDIAGEYGFSYQPAQSTTWGCSNPIKLWRDTFYFKATPIVDRKFDDHPIEMIALERDRLSNNLPSLKERMKLCVKYNLIARENNKSISKKIFNLTNTPNL